MAKRSIKASQKRARLDFEQGYAEQTQQRKSGKKRDSVSRFLAYLVRIQTNAEAVLKKAGHADPSALIRDPLTGGSRFYCSPEVPDAIHLADLPLVLTNRRQTESYAFELLGWVHEMREVVLRTPLEGREALVLAFWLGGNIATAKIGMRLPEVGAVLKSWRNSEAATGRAGIKGELRQSVERICKDLPEPTLNAVLEILQNEEVMDDLYGARTDPIHIIVQEIHRKSAKVDYRTRGGNEKTVTFDRLERLIRDIKAEG
jgi:hypothetical protein